uniref:Uncharacterized protein n=1 Tax=Haemonchus contortus TaxID=6289 RepID=W6N9S0_HAECO
MRFRKRSPKTSINWDHFASLASKWEDSVIDNIDEEYNRLVEHLHDSATKAESLQVAKRRLYSKTLEMIRQRGIARATGNYQQTSELAKLCRETIKEDLKERRAAVMDEAAAAGKSIRKARRSFANYKTKMTSLRRPDGTVTASRRAMDKGIYDFYSDLFDSHVYLPTHHLMQDEYIAPSVLPFEIRHVITSMKNCTEPGPDRDQTRTSEESSSSKLWLGSPRGACRNAKCPRRGKLARPCCCTKREIQTILAIIAQSACCR